MTIVRAAITQTTWTGDKESMLDKHEQFARDAAAQGAQVICFQELFYGPYFCQVQDKKYYEYTEPSDGPTSPALRRSRQGVGHGDGAADVRGGADRRLLQHRRVVDADGTIPRQVPQAAHPADQGFWEKFYFRPGNGRVSGVRHRRRQGRRVHLLRPPLPRGLARARPQRRRDRVQPVGHQPGLSEYLWRIEQPARRWPTCYYVGAINRVGIEDNEYGDERLLRHRATSSTPGQVRRRAVGDRPARADRAISTSTWTRSSRCATLGSSTATAARTPTTNCDHAAPEGGRSHGTTLIKNGTVISTTGRAEDVLIDGETIVALCCRPATSAPTSGRGRQDHRRDRQVRHPGWRRRAHAHGAALRRHLRQRHLRDRHPRRGVGRHTTIVDMAVQTYGGNVRTVSPLARQGRGQCAIDYAFHQIIGGVDDQSLKAWCTSPSTRASPASSCSWPTRACSTATTARSCGRCRPPPTWAPRS
jgi:beta-ureidopropionase